MALTKAQNAQFKVPDPRMRQRILRSGYDLDTEMVRRRQIAVTPDLNLTVTPPIFF